MALAINDGFDQSNTIKQNIQNDALQAKPTKKISPSKALLSEVNLADLSAPVHPKEIGAKSQQFQEEFAEELEKILAQEEKGINQEISELEKNETSEETITKTEEFKELLLLYAEGSSEAIEGGIKLLETILPEELLDNEILHLNMEIVGSITEFAGIFLNALDVGSKGLAVICKAKILTQSYELLKQLKEQYRTLAETDTSLTPEQVKQFHKKLLDWEAKLAVMEKTLVEEKVGLGLSATAMTLSLAGNVLKFLPWRSSLTALKVLDKTLLVGLAGLSILGEGLTLIKDVHNASTLTKWSDAFKEWQKHYHHIGNKTEEQLNAFKELVNEDQDIEGIRIAFKAFNIEIDAAITSKNDFLEKLHKDPLYQEQLFNGYIKFQMSFEAVNVITTRSGDLLEKRKAIAQKKIKKLMPNFNALKPKIKELKQLEFNRFSENERKEAMEKVKVDTKTSIPPNEQFSAWFDAQSKDDLLHSYVDHQETLEITTKNALREIIDTKHSIEKRFLNFKKTASSINFSVAAIALAISGAIALAGLLTLPLGGVGFIMLGISVGPIILSIVLGAAGLWQAYREKPATFVAAYLHGMKTKILWAKIQVGIRGYFNHAKEKKLIEVAKILHQLQLSKTEKKDSKYLEALNAFKKAKADFEASNTKVKNWTDHLNTLQNTMAQKGWQDIAAQASLEVQQDPKIFDTLRAFNEAIQQCDLQLFSEEMKTLLELQLGVDIESLQSQINKDPSFMQKILMEFSLLDDSHLLEFLHSQNARIKSGSILPSSPNTPFGYSSL